jgi:hypothetical protein
VIRCGAENSALDLTQKVEQIRSVKEIEKPKMNAGGSANDLVLAYNTKLQATRTLISSGRITRLYYLPYEGEHMFEINEGEQRSSWPRPGDSPWFVVGYFARIEHTQGDHPRVIRIWIGDVAKSSLTE